MPAQIGSDGSSSGRSRLFYFNTGFFTQSRIRRILDLAGYDLVLGKPGADDLVAVWGRSPTSGRGEAVSTQTGASLIHIEDAFIRSVETGRSGAPPIGLTIDAQRPYFDAAGPSDLETLLATAPLDDAALMTRARHAIEHMRHHHISKYNAYDLQMEPPKPGYVLVIDQTRHDASIKYGRADANSFREMLVFAQQEHRGQRILIKTHPETLAGHREGHFSRDTLAPNIALWDQAISPHALLEGAVAVYTVSSGIGFEAILAGHKPIVFGQPFYAGWGLSDDRQPIDRRQRKLTRNQLFAGAMMLYPTWYDPYRDRLCALEDVLAMMQAETRAWREDRHGTRAYGMRAWKRKPIRDFFANYGGSVRFGEKAPGKVSGAASGKTSGEEVQITWANHASSGLRVEDGFLRSRGLGADLVAPLSLVRDDLGIYYDPHRESRLEQLITRAVTLPDYALHRADKLRRQIIKGAVTKYNLSAPEQSFQPHGREVILIPGQVEDDASLRFGGMDITDNAALVARVRTDFPEAFLIYRPHPDVAAGLRPGALETPDVDMLSSGALTDLLARIDRIATITSLTGFEALLREITVTCYGAPFYAGWGLTDDKAALPDTLRARRSARPDLDQLIHACLIDYPRYHDPVTNRPAPPEIIVDRLANGTVPARGAVNRLLAKTQGLLSGFAPLWRK